MGLTKSMIDKMTYQPSSLAPGARDVRWDSEIPNFGVRVYPSNKKAFILMYRHQGRKRCMALGQTSEITLEQARKEARIKLGLINQGIDPLASRQELERGKTMKEFCDIFVEQHSKPHKRSWTEDVRKLKAYVIPAWGTRQLRSITNQDVVVLHQSIGEHSQVEANRTLTLLGTMFKKASLWGFLPAGAGNPAVGVTRFKEKSRDRWVTHEEMPRLAQAIDAEKNEYAKAALWMYILTGARKSELLRLKWSDVDFQRAEIRLRDTKNGTDHILPISTWALEKLRDIPRTNGNPFVFVGHIKGRPLVNITKPWFRVRKAAGIEDVWLHDLRRTVGSWMAQRGYSLHVVGKALNHRSASTTEIYARLGQNPLRNAFNQHSEDVRTIVEGGAASGATVHQMFSSQPSLSQEKSGTVTA